MMHPAPLAASFSSLGLPSSPPAVAAAVRREEPAALAVLGRELVPYLLEVPDPRGRQGRRSELTVLLVLCLVGFCTGCQGYLSGARWGRALKPEVLQAFGFSQGRTPCAATWLNLFRVLDWDRVARQFHAWAEAACLPPPAEPRAVQLSLTATGEGAGAVRLDGCPSTLAHWPPCPGGAPNRAFTDN